MNCVNYDFFEGEGSPSNLHLNTHWRHLPGNENLDEPKYVILDYIHHYIPQARIVVIFRNPVDRWVGIILCVLFILIYLSSVVKQVFTNYSNN